MTRKGASKSRVSKESRDGRPQRKRGNRPFRTKILIVGEGKTEANYFRGAKGKRCFPNFRIDLKFGKGNAIEKIIEEIRRSKVRDESYDYAFCLLDTDVFNTQQLDLKNVRSQARANRINLCMSNPCFEIWLFFHFEKTTRHFQNCSKLVAALKKLWKSETGKAYNKSDDKIFEYIEDRLNKAIANAIKIKAAHERRGHSDVLDCNPCTDVYKLVEALLGKREITEFVKL